MTTQIAVRLPDEMVTFIDQLVDEGKAKSRAAVVTRALRRERRRRAAEQDALVYASSPPDLELDEWVSTASGQLDLTDFG